MKRFLAILICICMVFSIACSAVVYADDTGAGDDTAGSGGDTAAATPDQEEPHEHVIDDRADQIVYTDLDEITVEVKKELLNSAELHPMTTGYEPLDELVASIHSRILTPDMDTYEKVCTIYKYLMTGTEYLFGNPTSSELHNNLIKTHNYKSKIDYYIVYNAYGMLIEKYGVCNHYSSAFMVMTRALGLDSYIASCTSSTKGLNGHFSAMIRLNGRLYRFDPVMGVVTNKRDIVEESEFFCTPLVSLVSSEFSFLEEQVASFGKFERYSNAGTIKIGKFDGKTEGDIHYTFGSYPQSRITDEELLAQLDQQLDGVVMNSYPYTCGTDEPGSQEICEYMSWADITYNNEKYRAVRIDEYRPKYIHRTHDEANSHQVRTGYTAGNTYWFKFEPIEWRLVDGNNLLVADLVLDSQPFNEELYYSKKGKRISGKTYYVFSDEEMTHPANDWEYSSIRRWLNEEFYNTAFTAEEQRMILDSQLDNGCNFLNLFEYQNTTDKVFMLSFSELRDSDYYVSDANISKRSDCSDYALSQGANYSRKYDEYGYSSAWLLRSPGMYSGEIYIVSNDGVVRPNINAGATNAGIKPVIRIKTVKSLVDRLTDALRKPRAYATGTGQITLRSIASNGADGYKFYVYSDNLTTPDVIYTSLSPTLVINDLIPGKIYHFRRSAYRLTDGELIESPLSGMVDQMCRTLVEAPSDITAEAVSTGTVRLSFKPVEGAVEYRVYRYIDSETLEICASSSEPVIDISGLKVGSAYGFRLSSVSDDGYESNVSKEIVSCVCESFPKRPENITVDPYATGKLRISWDAVNDAVSYNVFRYYSANDIEFIGNTTDTTFSVSGLRTKISYYFKIQAVGRNENDLSVLSWLAGNKCVSVPPVPDILSVEPCATHKLEIKWDAVEGAATYNVYRYLKAEGLVLLGSTDRLSFVVSDLNTGDKCFFRVEAVSEDGNDISDLSALADGVCESYPAVPQNIEYTPLATGKIKLSWDPSVGAAKYNVYRYISSTNMPLLGTTEKTEFIADNLVPYANICFKIQAITQDGNDTSDLSPLISTLIPSIPDRPLNTVAYASSTGCITVEWDAVEGVGSYNVYRYFSDTKTELLCNTEDTSYVMSDLSQGSEIFFTVQAVSADGKDISAMSPVFSSKVESIPPVPINITAMVSDRPLTVDLKWDAVEGATGYEIYKYNDFEKFYEYFGKSDKNEFEATGLKGGAQARFSVYALKEEDDNVYVSARSNSVVAVPTKLAVPTNVSAVCTETCEVTLSWDPVPFADRYDVYLYDNADKEYILAASSESNVCKVVSLAPNTTGIFRVTAVCDFDTYEISSAFSSSVSCKALSGPAAVQSLSAAQMSDGKVKLSWSAVSDATRYNIYSVFTGQGGGDELLGTTETTSFTAENLTKGMFYRIYVRAIKDTGEYTLTGEPSNTIIVDIPADKTYIIGDVDGNGAVDILDATFVQRYATGLQTPVSPESMMHGDIDGDGAVGIIDATFIQRYSTALAIPYPIDCPSA